MNRSLGFKFLLVGLLALLMAIPLFLVGGVIGSRADYNREAIESVSAEWGGRQSLIGPQLEIPVEKTVTKTEKRRVKNPESKDIEEQIYEVTEIISGQSVYVFPEQFHVQIDAETEVRYRGIYDVPVYVANSQITVTFRLPDPSEVLQKGERMIWDQTKIHLKLQSNRALRGQAKLQADHTEISLEPRAEKKSGGIFALTGDPRKIRTFTLLLEFNGAQSLLMAPVGRGSRIEINSDWPHPSFTGAFLPDDSMISDSGFSATWTIPYLARPLPQFARGDSAQAARTEYFGVDFLQPNDLYQKAYRTLRYSMLFIALTFLTMLLIENRQKHPVHPVQYLLVGLAQSVFILLMVAYAEHLGFISSYLLSSAATIALLIMFGALGLKLGRKTLVLGSMLIALYAVLYLILESIDYALLMGATLAFLALVFTMYSTRNENWYGMAQKSDSQQSSIASAEPGNASESTKS